MSWARSLDISLRLAVALAQNWRRTARAVTKAGQSKGDRGRHEKDDRHRIDDRSQYVLGWSNERKLVQEIHALRAKLAGKAEDGAKSGEAGEPNAAVENMEGDRLSLLAKVSELEAIVPDKRMIYAHVDEHAVALVAWSQTKSRQC